MKKQNVRTLSLIVCTFTYLLVGAAVFDALESENEVEEKYRLEREEDDIKRRYNMSEDDFTNLTHNVIRSQPHKAGIQWKFAGAFYFATIVITTIGYGHSTPKTIGGKLFCMGYAFIGIPLTIVMFQSIGERLNIFATFLLKNIKKCFKFKNPEVSETNLIIVCMNMSSMVVAGGACAFAHFEGWSLLDSFYYCFITLTTIGFGDLVALQTHNSLQERPEYVAFTLIFILFGLTVISAAMNLMVLRFLTMNTEDERQDLQEAAEAAKTAVHLEGDIITAANGSIVSGHQQERIVYPTDNEELTSVCSCSCYNLKFPGYASNTRSRHYTIQRSPGNISHLLPMENLHSSDTRNEDDTLSVNEDSLSFLQYNPNHRLKRASI